LDKEWLVSANNGILTSPIPPSFLATLVQANKEYSESVEANKTSAFKALNFSIASEKAVISVGQTKVKANGMKPK